MTYLFRLAVLMLPLGLVMGQSTTLKVGDVAPDFELMNHNREVVKLSDYRGSSNVIIAFYVFAFTGG